MDQVVLALLVELMVLEDPVVLVVQVDLEENVVLVGQGDLEVQQERHVDLVSQVVYWALEDLVDPEDQGD